MHKKSEESCDSIKSFLYFCMSKAVLRSVAGIFQVREESPGSIEHPTSETRSYW